MSEQVKVRRTNGTPDVTGITVSEGPRTYRLLVTDPYRRQGRIVEIPHEESNVHLDVSDGSEGAPFEDALELGHERASDEGTRWYG